MIRRTWLAKSLILQFLEIVVSSNTKINLGNINVLIISLVVDSLGAIPQQLEERLKERLWNYKSIECFPLTCDLNDFKSRINRQLLNVLTALIFLCFFFPCNCLPCSGCLALHWVDPILKKDTGITLESLVRQS